MVTAIVGAASVAASVYGSSQQSKAAKKAASSSAGAASDANAAQLEMYNQTREDTLPQINAGQSASNQLSYLMGLTPANKANTGMFGDTSGTDPSSNLSPAISNKIRNLVSKSPNLEYPDGSDAYVNHTINSVAALSPEDYQAWLAQVGIDPSTAQSVFTDAQAGKSATVPSTNQGYGDTINPDTGAYGSLTHNFDINDFKNNMDPAYQWDIQQGQEALQRTQSADGGLLSGAAAKAISDYTQNQASNEYGNAYNRYNTNQTNLYNRLAGISGTGMTGSANVATSGTNAANQIGGNLIGAANAQGAAGITAANSNASAAGSAVGGIGNLLNSSGLNSLFGGSSSTGIPSGGFAGATGVPFNTQYEF